jgi:hypothetical protein
MLTLKTAQEFAKIVKGNNNKIPMHNTAALGYATKGEMDKAERTEFWKGICTAKTQEELDAICDYYKEEYGIDVKAIVECTPEQAQAIEAAAIEAAKKQTEEKRAARASRDRKKADEKKPSQNAAQKEFKRKTWEEIRQGIKEGTKINCFIRECEILEINDKTKTILAFGKFGKEYYEYEWTEKEIEFDSVNSGRILLADRKNYAAFTTDYILPVDYEKPQEDNSAATAIKTAQKASSAAKKPTEKKPSAKKAAATKTEKAKKEKPEEGEKANDGNSEAQKN